MNERCELLSGRRIVTLVACAGGLASLFGIAGCEQRSESARNVERGSQAARVLTGNGGAWAEDSDRGKTMKQVLEDAKSTQSDDDTQKAASNLLAATAQIGLAVTPTDKATDLDLQARNKITLMQAWVNEWATNSSTAAAAEGFDPATQLEEMSKLRGAKLSELAADRNELQKLEDEANGILGSSKSKIDAATAKHAIYNGMVSNSASMSAAQAAEVVTAANVIRREADGLRLEGMRLQADAEALAPRIRDLKLKIEQLSNQIRQFDSIETVLREKSDNFRSQFEDARNAATVAANRLDGAVGELEAIFDGELKTAFDDAIDSFAKARGSSSSAQTAAPGFGRLSAGESQLHIADMQWSKSQAFGNFASTLRRLAGVKPTLPQAKKYAEASEKYRAIQTEALKEAASAFESAESAFDGARVSGPSKERLDQLGTLIEKARKVTSDETVDVAAEFGLTKRAPEYKGESVPDAGATPATDPALMEALTGLVEASKGGSDWTGFIKAPESIINVLKSSDRVEKAMKAKFNVGMAEAMGSMAGASIDFGALDPTSAAVTMTGADTATVIFQGSPMPMKFVKSEGAWKLDIMASMGPQAQMMGMMAGAIAGAMDAVAADIESGAITDAQGVGQAIQAKMMEMMGGK